MKEYRATITVNVFLTAENQEEADEKFGAMELEFKDPDKDESLMSDLIDMEVTEVGELDVDDFEEQWD